jgi:hypothetical protein
MSACWTGRVSLSAAMVLCISASPARSSDDFSLYGLGAVSCSKLAQTYKQLPDETDGQKGFGRRDICPG